MKVVLFVTHEVPVIKEIENNLKNLQEIVDGYIEVVFLSDNTVLICDEDGKLKGKEISACVKKFDRDEDYFNVVGTFIICGIQAGEFCDIMDDNMVKVLKNSFRVLPVPNKKEVIINEK